MNEFSAGAVRRACIAFVCVLSTFASFSAHGLLLYAYQSFAVDRRLASFDSATPGTLLSNVALTGLFSNEYLVGIDVRPATGQLYAVSIAPGTSQMRVLTVDPATGAVTQVNSAAITAPVGNSFGMAFDPVMDQIRLVSDLRINLRLNPQTGAVVNKDADLDYVAGDIFAGTSPAVYSIAYTNPFANAPNSTLFGIDYITDTFVRIGGVNGTPSPNGGQVSTIGPLGVSVSGLGGFAIAPQGNAAFAAMRGGGSVLHSINLVTGAATSLGVIGGGMVVEALAVAPVNSCLDLDGDGIVTPTTDGLMLLRALLGMTGTAVTTNAMPGIAPPRSTWSAIRTHMNTNCGMNFAP